MRSFAAPNAAALLEQLPEEPGVYILKDELGHALYVGKSGNIRKRVRSHFSGRSSFALATVESVESILTGSELEALILECNLIKRLRPPFNVRLKDDKSYPYIKVTMGERYPGVYISRVARDDGSIYFGPYADVGSARRSIKVLRQVFPIRGCKRRMDRPSRPCLDFHIKRCAGPCTGKVDPDDYSSDVRGMIGALQGRKDDVLKQLEKAMHEASLAQNYERAAVIRDRLSALERTTIRQRLSSPGPGNMDVLGVARKDEDACVQMLFVRDGSIIEQEHFILQAAAGSSRGEVLASFVKEYYSCNPVPPKILAPFAMDDLDLIGSWFASKCSRPVEISTPSTRDEGRLVSMATRNAELMLRFERQAMGRSLKLGLQDLARASDMVCLPRTIEAFDISNMSGKFAVGSMVRFQWGRPCKALYRRFRISSSPGRDDYTMMREIVTRRFRRGLEEGALPDLVLVDGGAGQASAAAQAIASLGLAIPVVGLAKRLEELYKPGCGEPICLPRGSPALLLLRRIRDEAHRFAISYHRALRQQAVTRSELDLVPGIGPKRKAALLRRFGGVGRIRRSSEWEVAATPGIGPQLARAVLMHLRGRARGRVD